MYWEVGIKMDGISGVYNVHPQPLEQPIWNHAVEHALDMAQALYPDKHIELEFVKEFDSA
jgi:hypothetical protein